MAKDLIHASVKVAMENEGWKIINDPFTIDLTDDDTYFDIDLEAERPATMFEKEKIVAIEIKSFLQASVIHAFHEALGQFLNYKAAIQEQTLHLELFLAVSEEGWERLNAYKFIQRRILQYGLKFMVVSVHSKTIIKWIR